MKMMTLKDTIILASLTGYSVALYHREHLDDEPMKGRVEIPTISPVAGATADAYRPGLKVDEQNGEGLII